MKNFSLSLLGSELLFFLLLLALIGLSYFVYRRTNPPVANWLKSLLTTVRVLVLFFILFILFAPILKLTLQKKEQPIVAVLLDTSASMAL